MGFRWVAAVLVGLVVCGTIAGCASDDAAGASPTYTGPRQMDAPYVPPVVSAPSVDVHTFQSVDISWQCDESFASVVEASYGSVEADSALAVTAYRCASLNEWASAARSHPEAYGVQEDALDDEFLTFALMSLCEPSEVAPAVQTLAVCVEALDQGIAIRRS